MKKQRKRILRKSQKEMRNPEEMVEETETETVAETLTRKAPNELGLDRAISGYIGPVRPSFHLNMLTAL
jgi:hypothetical protein